MWCGSQSISPRMHLSHPEPLIHAAAYPPHDEAKVTHDGKQFGPVRVNDP